MRCDLPVGALRWEAPEPRLTVVVKATFSLDRERAWLAPWQAPLSADVPSPFAADELAAASDFAPYKPRADVLLLGAAHAEQPAWALPVSVAVGDFRRDFHALAAAPRTAIPLSSLYLRAGPRFDAEVVRVGPSSPRSSERRALAQSGVQETGGSPRRLYGPGFHWGFFNAAPREQQLATLGEGLTLRLAGLLPGAPLRVVTLPGMRPRVHLVERSGRRVVASVAMRCDTLVIDTERAVCSLVWRGICDDSRVADPCLLVAFERPGPEPPEAQLLWDFAGAARVVAAESPSVEDELFEQEPPRSVWPPRSRGAVTTLVGATTTDALPALPFVDAPQSEPEPAMAPSKPARALAPSSTKTIVPRDGLLAGPALPFLDAAPVSVAAPPAFSYAASSTPPISPPVTTPAPEPAERPAGGALSIATYTDVQAAVWTRRATLAEALASHGLHDEHAFRVAERRLLHELSREAREGKSERLLHLSSELRRRVALLRASAEVEAPS